MFTLGDVKDGSLNVMFSTHKISLFLNGSQFFTIIAADIVLLN